MKKPCDPSIKRAFVAVSSRIRCDKGSFLRKTFFDKKRDALFSYVNGRQGSIRDTVWKTDGQISKKYILQKMKIT